ncbi:MAG: cell envelope biogenesis protein TolA [Sphingomonas sp.]|uniref:cell envelope biogenesis protein TolA n=1 Tax=Sphingomonas sp. TaxID=28214 RepID=UPI0025D03773|nr:cell envelope biogenesis protein TolA [Sphingomonas sp.]MBX9882725.1 cell envelope biogenesis protein TolA [Sphingomonas sp.]
MDRAESTGLGVALIAHLAVLAWLSSNWLAKPVPPKPLTVPVTVSLVDAVALQSSAPATVEAAPSQAPDLGPPEEAAPPPPEPAPPVPRPSPPEPAPPKPQPAPKPAEVAAPKPPQPKPAAKPAPALAKTPPQPAPAKPAPKQLAANDAAKAARPRGSRLSDELLKGLTDTPSPSKTVAPKGAVIDAKALASIQDAIRRQIQPCADRQVNPGPGANEIVTTLNLRLNPDGSLADDPKVVRQAGLDGENNRYARRVIDLGIAAFKACSPLKLPSEYYQTANGGWGNINYNWQLR